MWVVLEVSTVHNLCKGLGTIGLVVLCFLVWELVIQLY